MKIQQFSQIGKRSNNEDSLGTNGGLLTVCDGMGGHNFGERASAYVVQYMLQAFEQPRPIGKMDIQQQLNKVQIDLNQLLEKEPELENMGTTFTGIFITPDVWYAAHIGDSRIYLFRPSEKKLWHTWDHSLVGELMRTKEITVEAGRFHPMSNRIAKAIIAKKDGKPVSASIVKMDELKAGDVFLLCSDGVVEGWGDLELVKLFSDTSLSFEQKCKKLSQQCNDKSKDNNTALIVEIEESDAFSFGHNEEVEWTTFAEVEADYQKYLKDQGEDSPSEEPTPQPTPVKPESKPQPKAEPTATAKPQPTTRKKSPIIPVLIAVLAIVALALFLILKGRKPVDEETMFKRCKNVKDYREYVKEYGTEGVHYKDAKEFIENFVNDSIKDAREKDKAEQEKQAKADEKKKEKESKAEAKREEEEAKAETKRIEEEAKAKAQAEAKRLEEEAKAKEQKRNEKIQQMLKTEPEKPEPQPQNQTEPEP